MKADNTLMTTIRSLIISIKGGLHFKQINEQYKELMGEDIPIKSVTGCHDLLTFLRGVPGVSVSQQGVVTATSENTKHLEKMISRQKTKINKRRTHVKRLVGASKSAAGRRNQHSQTSQCPQTRDYPSHGPRHKNSRRQEPLHHNNYTSYNNYYTLYNNNYTYNNNYSTYDRNWNPEECFYKDISFEEIRKPRIHHVNGWQVIGDDRTSKTSQCPKTPPNRDLPSRGPRYNSRRRQEPLYHRNYTSYDYYHYRSYDRYNSRRRHEPLYHCGYTSYNNHYRCYDRSWIPEECFYKDISFEERRKPLDHHVNGWPIIRDDRMWSATSQPHQYDQNSPYVGRPSRY